jgi:DNA-binding beta-propeller fold protein YncE
MRGWSVSKGALLVVAAFVSTTAAAPPPVSTVFVTQLNGDVQQVNVSDGSHAVVGSTGVGQADSLVFDGTRKLLVSGNDYGNVFRIDPSLPGGSSNVGTEIPLPGFGLAADEAIDPSGTTLYVTDYLGPSIAVVDLGTEAVTIHHLSGATGISGIAVDAAGQLWLTDPYGHTVGLGNLTANTYTPLCM